MNHDTATPGTDGIETQTTHHGTEFDPDHDCELCSPPLITMPYPGRVSETAVQDPQSFASPPRGPITETWT